MTVSSLLTAGACNLASAQNVVVSQPSIAHSSGSGSTYYCARCGQYHASPSATSVSPHGQNSFASTTTMPGTGLRGTGGVQNVLAALNAQRARQGIGSLRYDPALQAVAQRRAQTMASMGIKHHPPGSFAPGTYEGVGWSSSYSPSGVSACFTSNSRMQSAGAAMATGRDGVYFAVVYR